MSSFLCAENGICSWGGTTIGPTRGNLSTVLNPWCGLKLYRLLCSITLLGSI